jgi:LPS-assembly lipoprotein
MMPLRAPAILLACLLLAACGFQLRGEATLPAVMDRTWLAVADEHSVFARDLARHLEASGVELVGRAGEEAATLEIFSERMQREALTITGQARVREFMLIFDVEFELRDGDGEVLIERERLQLTREYSFDEQEILAAQREQEFLEADLRRAMTSRVLRRLEAVGQP